MRLFSCLRSLKVGDKVAVVRKITGADVEAFTRLSGDSNPIHSTSKNERAVVHGALLNGLVSGVIGTRLPGAGTLVLSQTLNFPNKCYADEEVTVSVEISELRKIITVKFLCTVDECRKVVLHGDAKLMLKK